MEQNVSIAYLGPEGTYSDEAARKFAARMGVEAQFTACPSFNTIFESVDSGRCTFGVVPTENSLEGAVTSTLDNFAFSSDACILGEEVLAIHHCLLMQPGATAADITTIASHPQGLAQCRRYINEHFPGRDITSTRSTAESAQRAAQNKHVAGLANAYAAELHGATVVERNVEDHFGNETSFALIAAQGAKPVFSGDRFKTSLALFMQVDRPGTLAMILNEFTFADINLTKLQSRPTKRGLGDYMFFVDIEGSINDPHVQTALNCLRLKLRNVKVLGSYPVD